MVKSNALDSDILEEKENNKFLHHDSLGEKGKNIVSQFAFFFGVETYSHKCMCF